MTVPVAVGSYGLYPWFKEHGIDKVQPDDLERLTRLSPYGKVFCVEGIEGDWIYISYGDERFRVAPSLFETVHAPRFHLNQRIRINGKSGDVNGTVVGVQWHWKQERPYYTLQIGNRVSSKQFWEEDLNEFVGQAGTPS
ncbi:hypothetical protein ETAA8_62150 [Anatilimnocola aggregata]|uniref:Uncharacterized protein n=1 Tax=Anatilimnocola aggregata TaxID=2528021 RepID=A0A517YLF5_9BACT|nr:hypothetical protein [Anatilimnocola aggregata]QDU31062.1 hypothetical protein ETAA8_62150 [Anatilimnocola aggregata]